MLAFLLRPSMEYYVLYVLIDNKYEMCILMHKEPKYSDKM
jgi:hypothetical protein